jgi:hypothetical protein
VKQQRYLDVFGYIETVEKSKDRFHACDGGEGKRRFSCLVVGMDGIEFQH